MTKHKRLEDMTEEEFAEFEAREDAVWNIKMFVVLVLCAVCILAINCTYLANKFEKEREIQAAIEEEMATHICYTIVEE